MTQSTVPATTEQRSAVPGTHEPERYVAPPVDIYETGEGLTVLADMPGVDKSGLDIRVENGVLTIKGVVPRSDHEDLLVNEYALTDYFRQFRLSSEVDQERITARLSRGVLELTLPTTEENKPRQIPVQTN